MAALRIVGPAQHSHAGARLRGGQQGVERGATRFAPLAAQLGVDAVFDKSTEIDALVDYCARQCFLQSAAGPAASWATRRAPLTARA